MTDLQLVSLMAAIIQSTKAKGGEWAALDSAKQAWLVFEITRQVFSQKTREQLSQ